MLVYHSGALGDFVTALPALELLSRSGPLELWTRPSHSTLAGGAGMPITACYDVGSPGIPAVTARRAFVFAAVASTLPTTLRAGGMAVHAHSARPGDGSLHVVDFHAAAAAKAVQTVYSPGAAPHLSPRPQWRPHRSPPTVAADGGNVARWVVAPGSGSAAKNWPLERFLAVADALAASGATVAWLLGPAEEERGVTEALPAGATVWRRLLITEVAALLATSAGYLGNDSGTSHLAAALGVPTVAVFGATDPAVWAPRGPAVAVVGAPTIEGVAIDAVVDACRQLLDGVG